jgi:hypothetical protein
LRVWLLIGLRPSRFPLIWGIEIFIPLRFSEGCLFAFMPSDNPFGFFLRLR